MKIKIVLKAKKDFGTIVAGDQMVIHNDVFDENVGIAFFPIDKSQWSIVSCSLYTGIKDQDGRELYVGDSFTHEERKFVIKQKDNGSFYAVNGISSMPATYIWMKHVQKYITKVE